MTTNLAEWFIRNWIEITGAVLGAIYVFFSIKQHILTWLLGLVTSLLYIYVFFDSGFYADMGLQFYYVWVSIYGWVLWTKGEKTEKGKEELHVSRTPKKLVIKLIPISIAIWAAIWIILKKYTDSIVPIGDSFTTGMSIVATWMLARKKLEHWLVWIVVDFVSMLLFWWKGLYPTVGLFALYTAAAIWGFVEWKKNLKLLTNE